MLVLSRKAEESIVVLDEETGTKVTIKVVTIGKHSVRIGFEAPDHVRILRTEVPDEAKGQLKK